MDFGSCYIMMVFVIRVTLQAVFVVCVNLQGLFIFCFHCVRNTTARSEWKAIMTRIRTFTTTTSHVEGTSSNISTIPLQAANCQVSNLQSPEKSTRL